MKKSKFKNGIILHPLKMVYWYIPKVACTTLKIYFANRCNLKWDGKPESIHSYCWHHWEKTDEIIPEYYNFAYIRNPFERLISLYFDKIISNYSELIFGKPSGVGFWPDMPWEDFVRSIVTNRKPDIHWIPQSNLLPRDSDWIHLFDFDDDLFLRLLPRRNASKQQIKEVTTLLDNEDSMKLLYGYYGMDFYLIKKLQGE